MTCTLGACTGEGGRLGVGLLTTFISGFGFSFPGGLLGGALGALFCRGYLRTFLVHCPKNLWRLWIAKSCSSHI